jgi:hypothetical protein
MTHEEGCILLDKARKATRKLARNTVLRKDGQDLVIRFWETDVIKISPANVYTLDSGGYRTFTTKDRLNQFCPFVVGQTSGMWYVYERGNWTAKAMFADGMQVGADGKPLSGAIDSQAFEKTKRKVDRLVRQYIAGFEAHVMENGLQEPSGGDCWGCYMRAEDRRKEAMGIDHYLSHFEEKYYVPSLFYNAFMETGFGNPGLVWGMMKADIEAGRVPWQFKHVLQRFFRSRKLDLVKQLQQQH